MTGARTLDLVIADDYADIRLLMTLWSGQHGWVIVGEAADGQSAIDEVTTHRPDIVVLNVLMPVKNGLTAIPEIRRASPDTRIVVFSAYERARERALGLGAHAWVTKTGDWQTLFDAINATGTSDP